MTENSEQSQDHPASNDRTLPEGFRWERCACGLVQITTERVSVYGGRTGWGCPKCNLERAEKAEKEIERLTRERDQAEERSKACDQIAEGDYGWETLERLCVATMSVCRLRSNYERQRAALRRIDSGLPGVQPCDRSYEMQMIAAGALSAEPADSGHETGGPPTWHCRCGAANTATRCTNCGLTADQGDEIERRRHMTFPVEPSACRHEKARITCDDCGIDLRGAALRNLWQPIETAPNGEAILIVTRYRGEYLVEFIEADDNDFNWEPYKEDGLRRPTHWMPPPLPPDSAPKAGENHGG